MLHLFDLFFAPCSLSAVGIKARVQFILFSVLMTLVQQVAGQGHTQAHICLRIMQEHKGHIWYPGYIPRLWGGDISKTPPCSHTWKTLPEAAKEWQSGCRNTYPSRLLSPWWCQALIVQGRPNSSRFKQRECSWNLEIGRNSSSRRRRGGGAS
jgi:hypothetical protein